VKFEKAALFVNSTSDTEGDFSVVLMVDDDEMLLQMLCASVVEQYPNLLVLGVVFPEQVREIISLLYFDVFVSDINMPGLWGDKLITYVKQASPTTFSVAMTGCNMETAFAAGRAQPDRFFDKNRDFNALLSSFPEGLIEAKRRRERLFARFLEGNEGGIASLRNSHWRERAQLKLNLGFSLTEFIQSRRLVRALALLKLKPNLTWELLAILSGYSAPHRLRKYMEDITSFVNIQKL